MHAFTRRQFLSTAAGAAAGLCLGNQAFAAPASARTYRKLPKAMILVNKINEGELKPLKDAGFDGCESKAIVSKEEAEHGRRVADRLGLRIHSVLRGWADFNMPDKVQESLERSEAGLKAAAGYGATTMLMVPCRVNGPGRHVAGLDELPMPEPWEFNIEFDEKTGHVSKVADGDNEKYRKYIDAQNDATDACKEHIRKLIPVAEREKIIIILENVWNNLWVRPDLFKNFVSSFQSEWIQVHFDIGNNVRYLVPPHVWIRTLGKMIKKCHVKDYRLDPDNHGGKMIHPREGSVDWPATRQALDDIGYDSWLTIEDRGLPLKEFSERLDLIIAGK